MSEQEIETILNGPATDTIFVTDGIIRVWKGEVSSISISFMARMPSNPNATLKENIIACSGCYWVGDDAREDLRRIPFAQIP